MKIINIAVFILLLLSLEVLSKDFTLRSTYWGMTKDQVLESEKKLSPILNNKDEVGYDTTIGDIKFVLYYRFKDGKLRSAAYNTVEHYENPFKHVEEHAFLQEVLTTKYGKPISEIAQVPKKYEKSEKELGIAAKMGLMKLNSKWETKSTFISLELISNEKGLLSNSIIYFGKATSLVP